MGNSKLCITTGIKRDIADPIIPVFLHIKVWFDELCAQCPYWGIVHFTVNRDFVLPGLHSIEEEIKVHVSKST